MELRKTITAILTVGLTAGIFNSSVAQSFPNPVQNNLSIKAGAEIRKTDFRWSIAGNTSGEDPNIYSEIIFNPVRSAGYYFDVSYRFYNKFSISAHYNQLKTYDGDATDFDYAEDNRTSPTTELYLQSDKGDMRTLGAGLFYDIINHPSGRLKGGITYNSTKELFYLLDDNDRELNTTYEAKWKGPGLSLDGGWISPIKVSIGGGIGYHLFNYDAKANWNLIEDFQHPVSFIQEANGSGWNYQANLGYQFNRHIGVNGEWLYSNWKTQMGRDLLFLKTGEKPETQMNGAFKKSSGWRLSATYTF